MRMPPGEDRRFRMMRAVVLPACGLLGVIASVNDWSIGWIYLSLFVIFGLAAVYVHFPPWERSRRRRQR
jgi:hypothetical protein